MKDIPVFSCPDGIATLILREVLFRGESYILVRGVYGPLEGLLAECAGFCRAAGAERLFAAGEADFSGYPAAIRILGRSAPRESLLPAPEAVRLVPVAEETAAGTKIVARLDGEDNILVEYGEMELDIAIRFRVHVLMQELKKKDLPVIDLTPGIRSLQIHFDIEKISLKEMLAAVLEPNRTLPELSDVTVPSRIIWLPLSWDDPQTQLAAKRYQQTVRPNAPWCPSNPEFIRRING